MKTPASVKIALSALLLAAVAGLALLHLDNRRLQRHVAARAREQATTAALKRENRQLGALLADGGAKQASGLDSAVLSQVKEAQAEIAALERRAEERRAAKLAQGTRDAAALAANRDPTQGLTRLEYFQDRGQATPTAAFETLVWAVLQGDEARLRQLGSMSKTTREQAAAFIAGLPEEARAQWTPEKLATLWITGTITELPALQVTGERFEGADEAVVTFRTPRPGADEKVKLKLGPGGWRVVVPGSLVQRLEKKLGAVPPANP